MSSPPYPICRTTLYRLFDAEEELLYVGITGAKMLRFAQHRKQKGWWDLVARIDLDHFRSREEALDAEATAIESEMPRFNKALVKGPLPVQQGRYGILDCTECGKRADGDLYLGLCLFCTVMSMRAESES